MLNDLMIENKNTRWLLVINANTFHNENDNQRKVIAGSYRARVFLCLPISFVYFKPIHSFLFPCLFSFLCPDTIFMWSHICVYSTLLTFGYQDVDCDVIVIGYTVRIEMTGAMVLMVTKFLCIAETHSQENNDQHSNAIANATL